MNSQQISSSEELHALLATIDRLQERVSTLKRSQLLSLCASMGRALSHFRNSEFLGVSSAASPPISLQIVVSETCTVVGGAQYAGSAAVGSDVRDVSFCEKGVGDGAAILGVRSVSSQVSTTSPLPGASRARAPVRQAPPVRTVVRYIRDSPTTRPYMGSEQRVQAEFETSEEEDESEYPVGYFDDSADSCEEVEVEHDGHLAAPHFSNDLLEQEFELGTGSQQDSYGGVLEPPLVGEFLPQNEFNVGTVSFRDEPAMNDEYEYTPEEWAAWDAAQADGTGVGGAYCEDEYGESYEECDDYYYPD